MGTLTIRTDARDEAAIEELKALFNEASASKAILRAVKSYKKLLESDAEFSRRTRALEEKIKRVNYCYNQLLMAKRNLEDELDVKD